MSGFRKKQVVNLNENDRKRRTLLNANGTFSLFRKKDSGNILTLSGKLQQRVKRILKKKAQEHEK